MPIPPDHVTAVCCGQATCRYLLGIRNKPGAYICAKKVPIFKRAIDDEVARGQARHGIGDNCDGYPFDTPAPPAPPAHR